MNKHEGLCLLTEREMVWSAVLADVLAKNGIPFVKEPVQGAGVAAYVGEAAVACRFYVPEERLAAARLLAEELFGGAGDGDPDI